MTIHELLLADAGDIVNVPVPLSRKLLGRVIALAAKAESPHDLCAEISAEFSDELARVFVETLTLGSIGLIKKP